jgi:hypothetical protein
LWLKGKHHFEYQECVLEIFDYDEFENSDIKVNVVLEKKAPCWN